MYEYVRASLMVCVFSASMRSWWKIWLFIVHCVLLHMPFHHSMSFSENAFNKTNKAKGKEKGCRQISRGLNTSEWHKGIQSVNATPKAPHSSTVYGYPLLFLQRPSHWHTQTHTHTAAGSVASLSEIQVSPCMMTLLYSLRWPGHRGCRLTASWQESTRMTVSETSRLN